MEITINPEHVQAIKKCFTERFNGKFNSGSVPDILNHLASNYHIDEMSERLLRHLIAHIRKEDLLAPAFIMSRSGNGYWLTVDAKEQADFILQELNRVANIYGNYEKLHKRTRESAPKKAVQQMNIFI
ncbi:hypothetical protein HDC90_001149 [Pedobacter sp. AK013]|uniref:hypothetical protein n=1 Tax=Pedobacter sp. AK013 TaxID=2723071 RepID=UPI0016103CF4|nr:hypothetical protein [Pedobacter sp. AK013]MBB6236537.1 hypothetical protein [Pedobacter sp. AK013]